MSDLTQTRLRQLFNFDADAGVLIWRVRPVEDFADARACKIWNTRYAGTVAGCRVPNGYRLVGIDGKTWKEHRLIWIYANGPIPDGMPIDHVNGVRDANRLENLRLVTSTENQRNRSMSSNNTSGFLGVVWHKRARKWYAQIQIDGRIKHLGSFATLESAADARAKAEREFGFHVGHGKALDQQHD